MRIRVLRAEHWEHIGPSGTWNMEALEMTARQMTEGMELSYDLLGVGASRRSAPRLTCTEAQVRVELPPRADGKESMVTAFQGVSFGDFPGVHPGWIGRLDRVVTEPGGHCSFVLFPSGPPSNSDGCYQGKARLRRLDVWKKVRRSGEVALSVAPPCVIVSGLGAVELQSALATPRAPEHALSTLVAELDLDRLRPHLAHPESAARVLLDRGLRQGLPKLCAVPNGEVFHESATCACPSSGHP
jgi:hypothetical protein